VNTVIERLLHAFGYVLAYGLFFRAETPETVVDRLRLAYRLVGVRIEQTASIDGTERTVFRCPYRSLLADRYGEKWVCHEKLDRVDDGYVTYLKRHKGIDYNRPRSCEQLVDCADSTCCFSEISESKVKEDEP
jgi:hypothetical protein